MEKADEPGVSLWRQISPLLVYELTFVCYLVFYLYHFESWFKISIVASGICLLLAVRELWVMIRLKSSISLTLKNFLLLGSWLVVVIYSVILLIHVPKWQTPFPAANIAIPLLAGPPVIAFLLFISFRK